MLDDSTGKVPTNYWWKMERVVKSEMRRHCEHTRWQDMDALEDCDEGIEELFRQRWKERKGEDFVVL